MWVVHVDFHPNEPAAPWPETTQMYFPGLTYNLVKDKGRAQRLDFSLDFQFVMSLAGNPPKMVSEVG